ncbi:hypothetical protein K4F52_008741 [Lecanicillium sp. MT-2017a]|nr:hypothetical protein K4F52_008741 [Lecanicillium sp. MT-2017a]
MDMAFSALVAQAAAAPEFALTFLVTSALIVFVPWKATHKPIYALLNSEESKKDLLTETWRGQKIRELTFVGVSCAILASIVTGAIAWPSEGRVPAVPWSTKALWYSSLILGLTAISSAMQQSVALYRLGCYEDGLSRLRAILGRENRRADGRILWTVRWSQMVVWQMPVMLLNFAILLFISGVIGMLRDRAIKAIEAGGWLESDDVKIALVVGVFSGFSLASYLLGMLLLYYQTFLNSN